ncbi:NUDIX domain-containing protein [Hyphomonas sp.]|uniref:NUDIX domain-containing protein n=1 Tax=Hyphomonas sp. TaxID=87 RepID=UPI0035286BF3
MRYVRFMEHETLAKVGTFLRLDRFKISFPKFAGSAMSEPQDVVNVFRGDSVAGLLHIQRSGRHGILLVEQFRMPTLIDPDTGLPDLDKTDRDETAGRFVELMAGTRRPGEPWMEAFRRECEEETGFNPDYVEFINSFYPSPGACSEMIHLYYGRIDWPEGEAWPETDKDEDANFGDDSEDIRRMFVLPAQFLAMIERGEIYDGKCLAAAEWMRRPENGKKIGLVA